MSSKYTATRMNPYHVSVGAIINAGKGRVLVLKRPGDGVYGFITGTLEDNETLEQCLRREALEEAGAHISIGSYAGATQTRRYHNGQSWPFEKTTLWFRCTLLSRDESLSEPIDPEEGAPVIVTKAALNALDDALRHPSRWPGTFL